MISTHSQKTCFTCHYLTSEPGAHFCPECGIRLEEVGEDYTVPEEPKGCPHCGYMENEEDAKFCMECGNSLKEAGQESIQVIPTRPVEAESQEEQPQDKPFRWTDSLIWLPVASYFENGKRFSGKIWLTEETLVFDSRKHDLIEIPVDEVAKASVGDRDNLLEIQMKDGRNERFRLLKAEPWVNRITSIVEK